MYKSVVFIIFTGSCNHHQYLILEHLHDSKKKRCTHEPLPPPTPGDHLSPFSGEAPPLNSRANGTTHYVAFCVRCLLTQCVLELPPCRGRNQPPFPLYGRVTHAVRANPIPYVLSGETRHNRRVLRELSSFCPLFLPSLSFRYSPPPCTACSGSQMGPRLRPFIRNNPTLDQNCILQSVNFMKYLFTQWFIHSTNAY